MTTEKSSDRRLRKQSGIRGYGKVTHGYSGSRTYKSWQHMLDRCLNPACKAYSRYGGRRITVCSRWLKFESFLADMGEAPVGLTLDRCDNDGNYCKSNCRWATSKQQNRNRSKHLLVTMNGETKCLSEWCEIFGVKYGTVNSRINHNGWDPEVALTVSPGRNAKRLSVVERRQRAAAVAAVHRAVVGGRLGRPDRCESCGTKARVQGHHHLGYHAAVRLCVLWYCSSCHKEADRVRKF